MAGQDEAEARAALFAMQARLRDPYEALGVSGSATPADIRSAFFALTKRFHPARFGRMPSDVQRLANEVFLGLRAAHDALSRPALQRPAPQPGATNGTASPAVSRTTSASVPPRPSVLQPPPQPRVGTGPGAATPRPSSVQPTAPKQPAFIRATTELGPPPGRAPSPPHGDSGLRSTARPGATATAPAAPVRPGGDDKELANAIELLGKSQWEAARTILSGLATRSPQVVRYRALLAYSRGREAQLQQRIDVARVELEQALQLDPELQLAKTALGELFTRRK